MKRSQSLSSDDLQSSWMRAGETDIRRSALNTGLLLPRLLSHAGIPKLRSTAKSKLKFKGKGHEVC